LDPLNVKASGESVRDDQTASNEEPDLRVYFAAERTTLAWVRTGLAMMGFGFVVARFGLFLREIAAVRGMPPQQGRLSLWAGVALVALGVSVNIYAAIRQFRFSRQFDARQLTRPSSLAPVLAAGLLAVIGLIVSVYLIATRY
jgi:putative membrane protein